MAVYRVKNYQGIISETKKSFLEKFPNKVILGVKQKNNDVFIVCEDKTNMIKKLVLPDVTDNAKKEEIKAKLIQWFKDYPAYENKVLDWNKFRTINWSEIEAKIKQIEETPEFQRAKARKYGTALSDAAKIFISSGDKQFDIVAENDKWLFVAPYTYEACKFCDSSESGGGGAKWCIGWKDSSNFFQSHVIPKAAVSEYGGTGAQNRNHINGCLFIMAFNKNYKNLTHDQKNNVLKFMIQGIYDYTDRKLVNKWNIWNQPDKISNSAPIEFKDTDGTMRTIRSGSDTSTLAKLFSKYDVVKLMRLNSIKIETTGDQERILSSGLYADTRFINSIPAHTFIISSKYGSNAYQQVEGRDGLVSISMTRNIRFNTDNFKNIEFTQMTMEAYAGIFDSYDFRYTEAYRKISDNLEEVTFRNNEVVNFSYLNTILRNCEKVKKIHFDRPIKTIKESETSYSCRSYGLEYKEDLESIDAPNIREPIDFIKNKCFEHYNKDTEKFVPFKSVDDLICSYCILRTNGYTDLTHDIFYRNKKLHDKLYEKLNPMIADFKTRQTPETLSNIRNSDTYKHKVTKGFNYYSSEGRYVNTRSLDQLTDLDVSADGTLSIVEGATVFNMEEIVDNTPTDVMTSIKKIHIPDSITAFKCANELAFAKNGIPSLMFISDPENYTTVGFKNLEELTGYEHLNQINKFDSSQEFPFSAKGLRINTFIKNQMLWYYSPNETAETYEIPSSIYTVASAAFHNASIKKLSLPNSSEFRYGRNAFSDCPNLETIVFKAPPRSMGALYGSKIKKVYIDIKDLDLQTKNFLEQILFKRDYFPDNCEIHINDRMRSDINRHRLIGRSKHAFPNRSYFWYNPDAVVTLSPSTTTTTTTPSRTTDQPRRTTNFDTTPKNEYALREISKSSSTGKFKVLHNYSPHGQNMNWNSVKSLFEHYSRIWPKVRDLQAEHDANSAKVVIYFKDSDRHETGRATSKKVYKIKSLPARQLKNIMDFVGYNTWRQDTANQEASTVADAAYKMFNKPVDMIQYVSTDYFEIVKVISMAEANDTGPDRCRFFMVGLEKDGRLLPIETPQPTTQS